MGTLDVDWSDLELGFRDATGTENWLDLETGEVVSVLEGFEDTDDLRRIIAREPSRFARIQPIDAAHARRVMASFIKTLPPKPRRRLEAAARGGAGSLTRCVALLRQEPALLGKYYRFEQSEFWRHLEAFLALHDVEPTTAPPGVELFEGFGEGLG